MENRLLKYVIKSAGHLILNLFGYDQILLQYFLSIYDIVRYALDNS